MKILIANDLLDSRFGGGTASRSVSIANALAEAGCRVSTISVDEKSCFDHSSIHKSIDTHFLLKMGTRFVFPIVKPRKINGFIAKQDLLYLSGHWSFLNIYLAKTARKVGVPYVVCPAGSLRIWGRSKLLKKMFNIFVGTKYIKSASGWISVTEEEKKEFLEYGVKSDSIITLPNAFVAHSNKTNFDNERSSEWFEFSLQEPYYLYLGRLNRIKGPDILLDAFIKASSKMNFNIVFAGTDNGMQNSLVKIRESSPCRNRIHFTGYVTGAKKTALLQKCEALVIPSRKEAMSMVILEAAAHSKTAIVSDQCGLNNYIDEKSGLIVSPDSDSIAQALVIMSNKSRDELGLNLKTEMSAHFGWRKLITSYLSYFTKISNG